MGLDGLQTFFAKLAALTKGTFQADPVAVNVIGDELVVKGDLTARRDGSEIRPILPTEPVELALAGFKEGQQLLDIIQGSHRNTRIIAAARIGPGRVALLKATGERDHLGAPFWPSDGPEGQGGGKADVVKGT